MKVRLFDVCVLGQSIGGLVAALMLQRRGTKLVVLSRRNLNEINPTACEFLCGFTLKSILKRVGFHPTEVNAIPLLDSPLQVVFPSGRLDCHGDEDRFGREVAREFSERSDKILQLFKESYGHLEVYQHLFNSRSPFPPQGFFARREFTKMIEQVCDVQLLKDRLLVDELKSFDVGEDFANAVRAMELALTSLITPWTSGAHLAHLLTLSRWEGFQTPEGPIDLSRMLLRKIQERGGVVAECDSFSEIEYDRSKITGVRMKGGEWDEIRWETAVIGGDPRGLISMAKDAPPFKKWTKQLEELPVYARKAFQIFRVKPEGLPVGMKPQGLIMGNTRGEGAERRERVRALRYAVRWEEGAEGKAIARIGVTAFLPPDRNQPAAEPLGAEIRHYLKTIIPFLDQYLIGEPASPFMPSLEGSPGDFYHRYVYSADKPSLLGICGISPETPFKNVFHAGDMIFPGLGLDGEILAGLQVAHWTEKSGTA